MRTPGEPAGSSAAAGDALRPGDILAEKYEIEGVLGSGGMGIVLAARHSLLGTRVAIKVVQASSATSDGGPQRFLREARAAALLKGENAVRVLDVGTLGNGAPFMVMELLSGRDLRSELLERGALPVAEAADYLLQVCDALAEAHGRGIVHRDIKPANLFLTRRPDGTPLVKVLDFGLAKLADSSIGGRNENLTVTGMVVGSPPYMSPEQLRSLKLADARSDIWGLGVVAHELLTGERPFQGEAAAGLITSIIADEPAPVRERRPEVPEAFAAIVHHCLRKDPKARPQSIQEVAVALLPFAPPRSRIASAPLLGIGADEAAPVSSVRGAAPVSSMRGLAGENAGATARTDASTMPLGAGSVRDSAAANAARSGPQTTTLSLGSSEVHSQGGAASVRPRVLGLAAALAALVGVLVLLIVLVSSRPSGVEAPADSVAAASEAPAVSAAPAPTALIEAPAPSASAAPSEAPAPSESAAPSEAPAPSESATALNEAPAPSASATAANGAPTATAKGGAAPGPRPATPPRPAQPRPKRPGNTSDWR